MTDTTSPEFDRSRPISVITLDAELLLDQLEWHWSHQLRPRLDGLTDEEYLWEPAPHAWNVRRRGQARPDSVTMQGGSGEGLIDFGFPEPVPAPVTTIAWRIGHIVVGVFAARNAGHFGGPEADYMTWDYPLTAAGALGQLDASYDGWVTGVRGLTAEELAAPCGPSEGGWAQHSMAQLVLHINREAIHHGAEIALLRDLYAHR